MDALEGLPSNEPQPKKKYKSKFDEHFSIKTVDKNKNKQAECLLCQKKKVKCIVPMKYSSTSGLKRHLFKKHIKEYKIMYPDSIPALPINQRSLPETIEGSKVKH